MEIINARTLLKSFQPIHRLINNHIKPYNFKRLKIGISNNKELDTKDYVLGSLSKEEKNSISELYKDLCVVLDDYFSLPFGDLMSKYNRKNK